MDEAIDSIQGINYHSDISGLGDNSTAEPLLTVQEVCELLKVSKAYIYSLTHRQMIPHIKMLGRLRFRRGDIDRWLEEQEVRSGRTQT